MILRWMAVGGLVLGGLAAAQEEPNRLVNDVKRSDCLDARPGPLSAETERHYDGLKHFACGKLWEHADRLPEAAREYELALRADPGAVELLRTCVPINLRLERTVPALRLMRQALRRRPNQPDLWLRYAQELLDLRRYDEVVRTVGQAVSSADFAATPAFEADLYVARAAAFDALRRPAEAAVSYRQALRIVEDRERYLEDFYSPTAAELPAERAKLLERLGRAELQAGEFGRATEAFRQAAAACPRDDGRLELNLAEVMLAAKRPEEAVQQLRSALDKAPDSDEPYRLFSTALRQADRTADVLPELEKLRAVRPGSRALLLVLAEQNALVGRREEAGRLYREIFTLEPVPIPAACAGYLRLLVEDGKGKQALEEYQGLCQRPAAASWARAMTLSLLGETSLLRSLLAHAGEVPPSTAGRTLLLRLAVQARLWAEAESLARRHVVDEPRPTEAYLLWCQALLEQKRYRELAEVCRAALRHEGLTQPLLFHLELAKALAMQRQPEPALQAVAAAKRLVSPRTADEQKVRCTELYVLHLLGRDQDCVRQGTALLQTDLAQGPWGRQVRYLLGHALEATSQQVQAEEHFSHILRDDPNDGEATAALARILYLQNQRLGEAESLIRDAIELDYVARLKVDRTNPVPTSSKPNAHYQATLAAILLRTGRTGEAATLLEDLQGAEALSDPWVLLCKGDGCLVKRQRDVAVRWWNQARGLAEACPSLGLDLRPSLAARLGSPGVAGSPEGAVSPAVPASLSSPGRP